MARKTLLTEAEIRQFMKLANIEPLQEMGGELPVPGMRDDEEEDEPGMRDYMQESEDEEEEPHDWLHEEPEGLHCWLACTPGGEEQRHDGRHQGLQDGEGEVCGRPPHD